LNDNLKNEILLIDNSMDVNLINFNSNFKEIITLDYLSHIKLKNKKINHTESETFISKSEFDELDKLSYSFVNWHENSGIKNLIVYREVNVGKLFYAEFYASLLPVIKLFSEISKIVKKYDKFLFHVSHKISNFIKIFNQNFKEIKNENITKKSYEGNVNYEIKFNKKSFKIQLSSSQFKSIKKISENIFQKIFNKKYNSSKKSHVLVEFDTIKSQKLFSTFPNSSNFILYNRRRPYVWNSNSFSILKNSNVIFINENKLNSNEKVDIMLPNDWSTKTINELKEFEKFFHDFFIINNESFWEIIKKEFFSLCEIKFKELIIEIDMAIKFIQTVKPSTITIMYEVGIIEQILILCAKKSKIPIFLLQHGIYHDDFSAIDFNLFSGVLPKYSDYFLVWGKHMDDYCKKIDLHSTPIKILGNPFFDDYLNNFSKKIHSKYILLAAQGPTDFSLDDHKNSVSEKYIQSIREICLLAKKYEKELIIKLHPDPNDLDISSHIKDEFPNVTVMKTGNMKELIQNCELFLCIDISTAILEAQLLEKPTISISVKENLGLSKSKIFEYCIRTDANNLDNHFNKIFNDSEFKNNLILKGNQFLNDYLVTKTSASKNFIDFLNKF